MKERVNYVNFCVCFQLNVAEEIVKSEEPELREEVEKHLSETVGEELNKGTKADLTIDTTGENPEDDMAYNLNPDAKEFVPGSPTSLKMNDDDDLDFGGGKQHHQLDSIIQEDRIIAQSPRKNNGNGSALDTIPLPEASEFDQEVSKCPHDVSMDLIEDQLNGGDDTPSQEEMMNSKEQRDLDEEKEDCVKELIKDDQIKDIINNIGEGAVETLSVKAVPDEEDPMNMSFHQV